MKNLLILGFVSLLLFSVAAGLSVWLQQTKTQAAEEKDKDKDKEKKGLKDEKEKLAKDEKKDKPKETKAEPKDDGPLTDAAEDQAKRAELKRREARLEKLKAQQAIVLEDMSALRQEVDRAAKQRDAEVKATTREESNATPDPQPKKPAVLPTGFAERQPPPPVLQPDPNEKKNLDRLAVMIEAMPPETAAKLLQEMADGGKMDTAVKVLTQMRERAAGKVIAEITDRPLAAQLVNRMLELKKPPTLTGGTVQ